jgi:SAM-dependent methyltransferase
LDVACGTGNTALEEAKRGCVVTGVDIADNLLSQAKQRAIESDLKIQFDEGDAAALCYPDQSFDVINSIFGAMFAPNPDKVAQEFVRVCKKGGRIVMGNWSPDDEESMLSKVLTISWKYNPPAADSISPTLWGVEEIATQRFTDAAKAAGSTATVTTEKLIFPFIFDLTVTEVVDLFRDYYGPTVDALVVARANGKEKELMQEMTDLFTKMNQSKDAKHTILPARYLRVLVQI